MKHVLTQIQKERDTDTSQRKNWKSQKIDNNKKSTELDVIESHDSVPLTFLYHPTPFPHHGKEIIGTAEYCIAQTMDLKYRSMAQTELIKGDNFIYKTRGGDDYRCKQSYPTDQSIKDTVGVPGFLLETSGDKQRNSAMLQKASTDWQSFSASWRMQF